MRVSISLAVCALVSFAVAQDLSDLPQCAKDCVGNSLSTTGCQQLDITCICKSQSWIAGLSCCIVKNCNAQDQNSTIKFADDFCKTAGVTLPTSASCPASAGPTSTDRSVASSASASTPGIGGTSPSTTLSGVSASISAASDTVLSGTNTASATSGSETSGSSTGTPVTAAASAASTSPATAAANTRGAELGLLGLAVALFAMV